MTTRQLELTIRELPAFKPPVQSSPDNSVPALLITEENYDVALTTIEELCMELTNHTQSARLEGAVATQLYNKYELYFRDFNIVVTGGSVEDRLSYVNKELHLER